MTNAQAIADVLVDLGLDLLKAQSGRPQFAGHEGADALIADLEHHPHAFVMGCIADRQVKAEIAWRLPFELSKRVGGFDFGLLAELSQAALVRALSKPTPLHRFPSLMGENLHAAVQRIGQVYSGDASAIWRARPPSAKVVLRFLKFPGVGPKIATMATNILARDFKVEYSDYHSVDVSVDVHLRRVFTRLGLIPESAKVEEIVYRARALYPDFPGLLDLPAWEIGRRWCKPANPQCDKCYLRELCPTAPSSCR